MRFFRHDIPLLLIVVLMGAGVIVGQHVVEARKRAMVLKEQTPKMAECPICKMQIPVDATTPRYDHDGTTYYFMNEQMKQQFIEQVSGGAGKNERKQ